MATNKETIAFILEQLDNDQRFTTRAMFGEYALYAEGKVVALVCDDQLYVKITKESEALANICEKDAPYPGAKPHYLVEESTYHELAFLKDTLLEMAKHLPVPKKKKKAKRA